MNNTYDQINNTIRQKRRMISNPVNIDDIQFMIEESISDGEISVNEYIQLNSELSELKRRHNR